MGITELLQLRYFLKLAESEHLTKTAAKLRISPPSLSSSIKKLEQELGVALFTRSKQRIYLNENGKAFYQYISRSLSILDEGIESLHPIKNYALSIALTSQSVYADMLYAFEQKYPEIPLKASTLTYSDVMNTETLNRFDFYLGIIEDLNTSEREIIQLCSSESPVVMISRNHPLASKRTLRLEELKNMPFISITQENSSATQFVFRVFEEAHFKPRKFFEGNYLVRQKMVAENKAVAITTMVGAAANALQSPQVTFIPVAEIKATRTQSVSWPKQKPLSASEKKFIRFCQHYFKIHPWI